MGEARLVFCQKARWVCARQAMERGDCLALGKRRPAVPCVLGERGTSSRRRIYWERTNESRMEEGLFKATRHGFFKANAVRRRVRRRSRRIDKEQMNVGR